jgi:hypothetical protein
VSQPGRTAIQLNLMRISNKRAYNSNVFINCPFDAGYDELFRAIIFTVIYYEFVPRCAKELSDDSEVRIHDPSPGIIWQGYQHYLEQAPKMALRLNLTMATLTYREIVELMYTRVSNYIKIIKT